MILEIRGAGFRNKGAQLMLLTTIHELRERLPGVQVAVDPMFGPFHERAQLGAWQVFPPCPHVSSHRFAWHFWLQRLLAPVQGKWLRSYGCMTRSSLHGLIDISGFAYSDEWGPLPTRNFAALARYHHSRGRPVILLPQAFGPFRERETKDAARAIFDAATIIFPRDAQSYQYVMEIEPDPKKVIKAPDITLFYPVVRSEPMQPSDYVCIVPNGRLLIQGGQGWSQRYQANLVAATRDLCSRDMRVVLVTHDTSGQDAAIVRQIYEEVSDTRVTILTEKDPLRLKEIIGNSIFLIGSRYHSLIAAFSSYVPSIAMGWSHKYETLLKDFNCGNLLIEATTPTDVLLEKIEALADPSVNNAYREQLRSTVQELREENERMWEAVVIALRIET